MTKKYKLNWILFLRGNNGLGDTDDSDGGLQTALRTLERSWLQHGNNLPRTLTNMHERNTVTPLRITDKGRSESYFEKKTLISVARRENHMAEKKI